jgi:aspartate racemase
MMAGFRPPDYLALGHKVIGVVGGLGPYAGLDLLEKIFDQTLAKRDQDHLPVLLHSLPSLIADRTAYLLDSNEPNPGPSLAKILGKLYESGARVIGIPCNTAHSEAIFKYPRAQAQALGPGLVLVNMLEETANYLASVCQKGQKIAVLSTLGTYRLGLYAPYLKKAHLEMIDPGLELMTRTHEIIYHPEFGLKCLSNPVAPRAKAALEKILRALAKLDISYLVLGCTELPLAFKGYSQSPSGLKLVDPTLILARALIRQAAPDKLKPTLKANQT